MTKTNDNVAVSADATIFAWATPSGRAGVAILRISGPLALDALAHLGVSSPTPRMAHLISLKDPEDGSTIDHCLCLYFKAPASFTGEDVVELHTHGSRVIMQKLADILGSLPYCRFAEPGEFSRRAFLNNKMDLIEAEGLSDLIAAETESQRKQALAQMDGEMSSRYEAFRVQIIESLALLEAYMDFPDEEIPEHVLSDAKNKIKTLKNDINNALEDHNTGEKIRDGFTAVILGAPNVGKSSLINLLAGRDVAIVSDIAGTTRDSIEIQLDIGGYALTLIDTAGLRETNEPIEKEGIRRAEAKAEQADIQLLMVENISEVESTGFKSLNNDSNKLILINKVDLSNDVCPEQHQEISVIPISCTTSTGVNKLLTSLSTIIDEKLSNSSHPIITRARHRESLSFASNRLEQCLRQDAIELMTEDLRLASQAIGKVTGRVELDEILDVIFKKFCIGK